ncbi:MAG: hypothetical protein N3F05_04470 [Candidatus Diapherotrites archaeon]|nr:hypothetical protein [Candidatus Diapherotrites archaeon]
MGIMSSLREFYYHLEDRYYEVIDKISTKIPINKLTDAIDKVFPSFILFIILLFVLLAALVLFLIPSVVIPKDVALNVFVQYQDRFGAKRPLEGAKIEIIVGEKVHRITTSENGKIQPIILKPKSEVILRVSKDGFKPNPAEKSITMEDENAQVSFLLTEIIKTQSISFKIIDENTKSPIVKRVSLSFECSNKKANPPKAAEKYTDYSGSIQIDDVEIDCLPLLVTVNAQEYETAENVSVRDGTTIALRKVVELKPVEQKGRLIVNVTFRGELPEENIIVDLEKDTGAAPIFMESGVTSSGQVVFEVLPGKYRVRTKATANYSVAESQFINVGANENRSISLEIQKIIIGSIKIQVFDKDNSKPLANARVTLIKDNTQFACADTNAEGRADFHLSKDENFLLVVDHPDYCVYRLRDVRKSDSILRIGLVKYTQDCGGSISVKVIDFEKRAISGAKVAAFDENGSSLGLKELITDINGIAVFKGFYLGRYKFFAYKGFGSSWSDIIEFSPRLGTEHEAVIVLSIPKATLKLKVTNDGGEGLPFSDVIVKDAYTDKVIKGPLKIENIGGDIDINIDAGFSFYLYINNPDYAPYISERIVLKPEEQRQMHVKLEPKRISGEIAIEFLGLFKDGQNAVVLAAGKEYMAKFKVSVPESAQYDKFGVHLRVGKYNIMEKDFLFIKEIYAGGNPKIIRGISYSPEQGMGHDFSLLSTESAKWVNLEWTRLSGGTIYVYAKVKVKESASSEELKVMWRAWGLRKGLMVRDPEDMALGNAMSDAELYAKTYERIYNVGEEKLCTDKWCTVFKALDIEENVATYIDGSYTAKVGKPYKLYFSIANSSKFETDTFTNVKLKIFNTEKNITFGNYIVYGETVVKGSANANETPYIEVGNIKPNNEIHGEIEFSPKSGKFGSINLRLHDPTKHAHIFEETIAVSIIAARNFTIDFKVGESFQSEAPLLPSGVENTIIARIRDKQSGLEVSDAIVKVKDSTGNTIIQTFTGSLGLAEIKLPSLMPDEKLVLTAEKPDYEEARKEIRTDGNVINLEPAEIGLQLNVFTKREDSVVVRILNKTAMTLKLRAIKLSGEFYGIIDERKVRDWLVGEYVGKEIGPKGKLDIALKVSLSDYGKTINEVKNLEGLVTASVSTSSAYGHEWHADSKVKISVGIGGEVDDPSCLIASIKEWKAKTKSNEVSTDFSVKNNCTLEGKPIALKNLSAKIELKGNRLGSYYVKIGDVGIELSNAYPKILKGTLNPEETLPALLSFAPDGGIVGTAKATIIITAEHYTNKGKQTLSTSIETEIEMISLENCIRYDKSLIRIVDHNSATLKIETKGCKVPIDFMLDTKIAVSEKEFNMKADDNKELIVMPSQEDIPGQYPIYVMVKSANDSEYSFNKLIRVIIEPKGCLKLNRYEFDIYDDANNPYDGFDTALLMNECYKRTEKISISYDERDWWEAIKTGAVWGLVGFVYGGVRSLAAGKTFFGTERPSNVCSKAGYKYCGTKNLCKDERVVVVNNVTCCASECITEETGLHKDICSKKGYNYCGAGNCDLTQGKETVVDGVVCCTGKCKTGTIEKPENICKSAGKYFCKTDEICPDAAYVVVGDVTCCGKPCAKGQIAKPPITQPTTATVKPPSGQKTDEELCKEYYPNSRKITSQEECHPNCTFSRQTAERLVKCCKNDCTGTEKPPTDGTTEGGKPPSETGAPIEGPTIPDCYNTELECAAKAWKKTTLLTGGCDCYAAINCIYDEFGKCYRFGYCNNSKCTTQGTTGPSEPVEGECKIEGYFCKGTVMYWRDSCGNEGIQMDCAESGAICEAGNCVLQEGCKLEGYFCQGTVLHWKDSCGNTGVERDCADAGGICQNGNCVAAESGCQRIGYFCQGTVLHWKDSCGNTGVERDCADAGGICQNGNCVAAEGSSSGTTQPPSGDVCIGCHETLSKCQKANGAGIARICDCELAVTCEYVPSCSVATPCYRFKSCNNSFCSLGSSGRKMNEEGMIRKVVAANSSPGFAIGLFSLESITNIFKGNIDILGSLLKIDDPWTGALIGFIAGTLYTYWQQSQNVGVLQIPVAVRDLNILELKLLIQKGLEEEIENKIIVEKGKAKIENPPEKPLGIEKIEIVFKNNGIKQEDIYKPIYRILKVNGSKMEYQTDYNTKKKKDAEAMKKMEPSVIGSEEYIQKFHLQFNSYKAKPTKPEVRPEVSCKVGGLIGSTGKEALPKIKLSWNWNDIAINECDESGIGNYCDATQFSIELLKKLKRIDELLRGQKLKCPSAEGILSEKTQELDNLKLDVAVTKIRVEKSGFNATVIGTIASNNKQEMTVNAFLSVSKGGNTINCPEGEKAVKVIDKTEVTCVFNNLEEGLYDAMVRISPQLTTCSGSCKNENLGNDTISTKFAVGTTAGIFEKCEPYSTERLPDFIAANPNNASLKEALSLTNFNAYLMQDGYTLDFRKDFHEFSETKDFFSTPSWYKGDIGIGKYFSSAALFEFKSPFLRPESGYLPAGKYNVRIKIDYNNGSWCLFEGTIPNARIEVIFERLDTPDPDSVFYYMPFNGLVGVDSQNGRQGYGINFRQKSEETIKINEDVKQPIRTTTIANSIPIPNGWVEARVVKDFKTLHGDTPGVVLEIEKSTAGLNMVYSPSVATPLLLKVSGGERKNAYAFYQLTINNRPQEASSSLFSWSGLVKGCKDFTDAEVTEAFNYRRDIRGGVGKTQCAGSFSTHQYGVEWCNIKRQGDVFLKTILFTPQESVALLEIVSSSDKAVFISPKGTGNRIETGGIEGATITSVEKILKLVEEKKVCVAGLGSNSRATFFWNQQQLIDAAFKNTIESIPSQCIKSS